MTQPIAPGISILIKVRVAPPHWLGALRLAAVLDALVVGDRRLRMRQFRTEKLSKGKRRASNESVEFDGVHGIVNGRASG